MQSWITPIKKCERKTLDLQADDDASVDVVLEEIASASSSITTLSRELALKDHTWNLATAVPQPTATQVHLNIQQTKEVHMNPIKDDIRNLEIPESKAPIWRLYEQTCRSLKRQNQLVDAGSWRRQQVKLVFWCKSSALISQPIPWWSFQPYPPLRN